MGGVWARRAGGCWCFGGRGSGAGEVALGEVGRGGVCNCLLLRVASGPAQLGTGRLGLLLQQIVKRSQTIGLLLQQSQTFGGAKRGLGGEIEEGSVQEVGRLPATAAWSPHPPGRARSRLFEQRHGRLESMAAQRSSAVSEHGARPTRNQRPIYGEPPAVRRRSPGVVTRC